MTHSPCSGRKVGKVADTLGSTTTNGSTKEGKQNPSFEAWWINFYVPQKIVQTHHQQ